jgi:hypothetical protein
MTLFIMLINVVVGIEGFSACPDYSVVKGLKGVRGTLRLAQGRLRDEGRGTLRLAQGRLRDEGRGTGDPSLSSGQAPGRGTGKTDNGQCRMDNLPRSGSKGGRRYEGRGTRK